MTSINSVNTNPQLDLWIITKLFGAPSQDQAGEKTAASTPTITPGLVAGGVANTTAQALLKLKTGGDQEQPAETDVPPHLHNMTPDEMNALMKAQREMTSDQLSAAMYGDGLDSFVPDIKITFEFKMDIARSADVSDIERSQDPTLSNAQRQQLLSSVQQSMAFVDELESAYEKHQITFQNVSDIKGLDYKDTRKRSHLGF